MASIPQESFATAAGHWYDKAGTPRYTIIGKNGKERNTTLRDAREHELYPSVTTILRCAAAPALERWKSNEKMLSALTLPRRPDELEADWLRRVEQDWQETGKKAADRGTAIHGAVERHILGLPPDPELLPFALAARAELDRVCGEQAWRPERSFAHPSGYGGKTDLHSDEWLIDIKTKDKVDPNKTELYDDHYMQLAAYRHGLGIPEARCGILFVDRLVPLAVFAPAEEHKLISGLQMFNALLAFWQAKNSYRPH